MPLDSVARVLLVENPSGSTLYSGYLVLLCSLTYLAELIEEAVEVCLRAYPFGKFNWIHPLRLLDLREFPLRCLYVRNDRQ